MPIPAAIPRADTLARLTEDLKRSWRSGVEPDAAAAFRDHPDLVRFRSLVVDLAYEEYCLREEAGAAPNVEAFCRELPAFRSQVREVLRGHREIADHPELFVAAEVQWPKAGGRFAGLRVIRELGRGAFARAYLARDPEIGDCPVVIKVSPAPSVEGRTLGPVHHPHVVGVHWARAVDGLFVLCMPFAGAATLRDVLDAAFDPDTHRRSGRTILTAIDQAAAALPDAPDSAAPLLDGRESYTRAVATIFGRLAGALAHLHGLGVAHGDLKPSNVLLGPGGHPYLIDFNLAGGLSESLVRCGGTLPYMAPERIQLLLGGRPASADPDQADVYSFGVMLFEALTGRLPFEPLEGVEQNVVAADLLRRQAAGAPRCPRPFARLVGQCLDPDPAGRPSASDLKRALRRYLNRPAWSTAIIASAIGLCAVVLLGWRLGGPPAVPAPATPTTPDEFFARGVASLRTDDVAAAMKDFDTARRARPDGRSTAYQAFCLARSGQHAAAAELYRLAIDSGYAEAWVLSNRAYSLIKSGSPDDLHEAVRAADAALELGPPLRAARLNRAYARLWLHIDRRTATLSDPDECLADIDAVLAAGPLTADLCYKAALVYVTAGGPDDGRLDQAVQSLADAVRLGKDPRQLRADPVLSARLARRSDFEAVLSLPIPSAPPTAANVHVTDPPGI
jgi:tetratricopeptide (TPR) repeat protein